MEIEHNIKVFTMDADFENNVREMSKQGWMLVPGIAPIAVYHVVRMKDGEAPPAGATAKIAIDDSKVMILRNGELIPGT